MSWCVCSDLYRYPSLMYWCVYSDLYRYPSLMYWCVYSDLYRYPSPSRDDTSLDGCTPALRRRRQGADKYVTEEPLGLRFQRRRSRPRDTTPVQPSAPPRSRQR